MHVCAHVEPTALFSLQNLVGVDAPVILLSLLDGQLLSVNQNGDVLWSLREGETAGAR